MANIDFEKLIQQMLDAAKGVITNHWSEAKPYAEKEFKAFANNLKMIAELKVEGEITEQQARMHIEIQKSSIRVVLLTIEGLGILTVEAAINAAIDIVKSTVNTAIGWVIL